MGTDTQWQMTALAAVGGAVGAAALVRCVSAQGQATPEKKDDGMRLLNHTLSYGDDDMDRWTATDVASWLVRQGVSAATASVLEGHNVDGAILPHVTDDMLVQMGVVKLGDKMKILNLTKQTVRQPTRMSPKPPVSPRASTSSSRGLSAGAPASHTTATSPERKVSEQPPQPTRDEVELRIDEKYKEVVAGHVESLTRVERFLTSPEFRAAGAKQRQVQLKKVVELLTKLIAFSEDIPEKHSAVLVTAIKRVYGHVKRHDAELAEEDAGSADVDAEKAERLRRIAELKKHLVDCDASDLNKMMEELREVVAQIEDCNDAEELAALNEVFDLLQKKNEALQRRAEELRAAKAMHESAGEEAGELIVAIQDLLKIDFSSQPLDKQEEYLRLAVAVLSKYVNSPNSDPTLCMQLGELVKNRRVEYENNKKAAQDEEPKAALAREGSSMEQELSDIVDALKADEFERLPLELQFQALEHAYKTLDSMDQSTLSLYFPLVSELVALLKKRHQSATRAGSKLAAAQGGKEEAEEDVDHDGAEDEDNAADGDDDDDDDDGSRAPQNEVNLLPKVFKRLRSENFTNNTSQFEFNTLLWAVAQISQILSAVLPVEKYKELMQPVQQLLMIKMDQTTALPASRPFDKGDFSITKGASDAYVVSSYDKDHAIAMLPDGMLNTRTPKEDSVIVCVAIDSPGGTEAMEMTHLAYMMRKATGYETLVLTGDTATASSVRSVLAEMGEKIAWVVVRSSAECARNWAVFEDGDVGLEEIQQTVSPSCGIIFDQFSECTFASSTDAVRVEIDDESVPKMNGSCAWLFDGIFAPMVAELVSEEGQTHDLHSIFVQMQLHMLGMPADVDGASNHTKSPTRQGDVQEEDELETPDGTPLSVAENGVDASLPDVGLRAKEVGNGNTVDPNLPDLP